MIGGITQRTDAGAEQHTGKPMFFNDFEVKQKLCSHFKCEYVRIFTVFSLICSRSLINLCKCVFIVWQSCQHVVKRSKMVAGLVELSRFRPEADNHTNTDKKKKKKM